MSEGTDNGFGRAATLCVVLDVPLQVGGKIMRFSTLSLACLSGTMIGCTPDWALKRVPDAGLDGGDVQDAATENSEDGSNEIEEDEAPGAVFAADGGEASMDAAGDAADRAVPDGDSAQPMPVSDAGMADSSVEPTCTPDFCKNDGSCTDGPSGPQCECPEPSTGDRCELEICGPTTIQTKADVDSARACREIRGNFQIFGGVSEITINDFPHLTVVTGDVLITNRNTPVTERIALSALETVDGKLEVILAAGISVVSFPALTTIGTHAASTKLWIAQSSTLGRLEMPNLTSVHGDVAIQFVSPLCSLNMPRIATVTGAVTLVGLPNAPYSDFVKLLSSTASSANASEIGCCVFNDSFGCDSYTAGCRPIACP